MQTSLYDYCMERSKAALLTQWHPAKNGALTPQQIAYGSTRKVWWICAKGHIWQAAVNTRTANHTDCPYCAGRLPWPGETDLASQYQDLVKEWHPTRNLPLTPEQVLPGSEKKVWWKCAQGHEWQAEIRSRVSGCGCPVCKSRFVVPGVNDLASRFPDLAAEWDSAANGSLTPRDVTFGTKRKVWWRCEKGHTWRVSVQSRTLDGTGCPVCAGRVIIPGENDMASLFPELAREWNPEKNGTLRPSQVTPASKRRVWWICPLGHTYAAAVGARTGQGSGCPYCAGKKVLAGFNDLATTQPCIAAQWHPTLNGALTPQMVTAGSHKRAWWTCAEGHIWKAVIYSRAGPQRRGCPVCAGRVCPERQERYRGILAGME